MRKLLVGLVLFAVGCAISEKHAIVRVWDTGVSYAYFGGQPFVTMKERGACRYTIDSALSRPYREPHAGNIRVVVPIGDQVELPYDFVGQYREAPRRQEPLWKGGEPIVIEAPGKHAPPFRVELLAPPPIEPIAPAREDMRDATFHPIHVWQLRDLPVRWRGGGDAPVHFELVHANRRVMCDFPTAAGMGVVPAELLAEMPEGEASLSVSAARREIARPRGWDINVAVYTIAVEQEVVLDTANPKGDGSW